MNASDWNQSNAQWQQARSASRPSRTRRQPTHRPYQFVPVAVPGRGPSAAQTGLTFKVFLKAMLAILLWVIIIACKILYVVLVGMMYVFVIIPFRILIH